MKEADETKTLKCINECEIPEGERYYVDEGEIICEECLKERVREWLSLDPEYVAELLGYESYIFGGLR